MNIQAMMKQAQKLQKDMMEEKNKIDSEIFEGKSSIVTVEVKIDSEKIESDEIEMLQDMIVVAINDAMSKIDKETENKMGKFTQGMPGLF